MSIKLPKIKVWINSHYPKENGVVHVWWIALYINKVKCTISLENCTALCYNDVGPIWMHTYNVLHLFFLLYGHRKIKTKLHQKYLWKKKHGTFKGTTITILRKASLNLSHVIHFKLLLHRCHGWHTMKLILLLQE